MSSAPYPTNGSAPYNNMQPPPSYQPNAQQMAVPVMKVELKVSCKNLIDMDVFSKSDPFVVFFQQTQNKNDWREVARTEVIYDNLNPEFVKSFIIDYLFEEQQMVKFEVYDWDKESPRLEDHDYIGRLIASVGSIVGESGGAFTQPLQNTNYARKSPGSIIIRAEEVSGNRDMVTLLMSGKGLDKKDFFGKSDPYLQFERCNEDNSYSVVAKTEVFKNTLNPKWKQFTVSAQSLCNGDYDRTIRVVCNDWNKDGSVDLIGMFTLTLRDIMEIKTAAKPNHFHIINPEKRKKKSYKNSGTIFILDSTVYQKATFLDYLRGGLELNFVVAVDFTASNGAPNTRQSLHYNGPNEPSQYVQVLQAVGGILEDYDTDKLFPAFGFGAKLPPSYNVSHEFALNFNPANPNCQGVNGIIAAYYQSITNVQLYGPTNFAPVINNTIRLAQQLIREGNQYIVLMIITDGIISDMERTKEAIVNAASLPISIIIVGVGQADFEAMEELDGDVVRVSYRGKEAERDIVQFVPFRDFMVSGRYNPASGVRLAKEVLHELPEQLLEYMEKRKIKPSVAPPPYMP